MTWGGSQQGVRMGLCHSDWVGAVTESWWMEEERGPPGAQQRKRYCWGGGGWSGSTDHTLWPQTSQTCLNFIKVILKHPQSNTEFLQQNVWISAVRNRNRHSKEPPIILDFAVRVLPNFEEMFSFPSIFDLWELWLRGCGFEMIANVYRASTCL